MSGCYRRRIVWAIASSYKIVTAIMVAFYAAISSLPGTALAADCQLKQIFQAPMLQDDAYSPVISILVDGQPRRFLLDTGGFWSVVSPAMVGDYKLHDAVISYLGLQGIPLNTSIAIKSVQIGRIDFSGVEFYVGPQNYLRFDGTLGSNWLAAFDVEIDPVKNSASLFSKDHCAGQVSIGLIRMKARFRSI